MAKVEDIFEEVENEYILYMELEEIYFFDLNENERVYLTIKTGFKTHPLLARYLSLALPITLHDTTYFHL